MQFIKEDTLVIASQNSYKVNEFKCLLSPFKLNILTLTDFNIVDSPEIGVSFCDNAYNKAKYYAMRTNFPCLSDDSGLSVRALGGQPGIFTRQWAGADNNYTHAIQKINTELSRIQGHPDRRASFEICMAICFPGNAPILFEDKVEGEIVWPYRGTSHMGYDPIFIPCGHKKTFGEMTLEEKLSVSHRGKVFKQLAQAHFNHL